MIMVKLHGSAVEKEFLLMKGILPEIKPFFYQHNGPGFFKGGVVAVELVREYESYSWHVLKNK